ncbi:hypothetical protein [Sutcliffiella cohnii]|nr:hypothetical protein [Sutcliffiella cohnii]
MTKELALELINKEGVYLTEEGRQFIATIIKEDNEHVAANSAV